MSRSSHIGKNAESKGGQQNLPQRQRDSEPIIARERQPVDRGSDHVLNSLESVDD